MRHELAPPAVRPRSTCARWTTTPTRSRGREPTRVTLTIVKRFLQIAVAARRARSRRSWRPLRAAFPQAVAAPSTLYHRPHQHERDPPRREHGGQHRPPRGQRQRVSVLRRGLHAEPGRRCWRRSTPSGWPSPGLTARQVPGIHQWLLHDVRARRRLPRRDLPSPDPRATGPYQWTPTPPSLSHKYVIEDVPCGLVAMSGPGAGRRRGDPGDRRPHRAHLRDAPPGLPRRGTQPRALGLAGKTVAEIRSIVETGPTG